MYSRRITSAISRGRPTRWFSNASDSSEEILRATQLASVAVSSLLSALQTASRTPGADIQAYTQSASDNLQRVTEEMVTSRTRPSALTGLAHATFGLTGIALAAFPPRIRHACISGAYDALGAMHTEHLRELLDHERKKVEENDDQEMADEGGPDRSTHSLERTRQLKELTKTLRDTQFGAPEGSMPSSRATDLLLQAFLNKELKIDAATVAGASTNQLLTALIHAAKSL